MITVYTRPECSACVATKVWLRSHGFEFKEQGAEAIPDLGYTTLPVVIAGDEHWSGFQIHRLQALAHD